MCWIMTDSWQLHRHLGACPAVSNKEPVNIHLSVYSQKNRMCDWNSVEKFLPEYSYYLMEDNIPII